MARSNVYTVLIQGKDNLTETVKQLNKLLAETHKLASPLSDINIGVDKAKTKIKAFQDNLKKNGIKTWLNVDLKQARESIKSLRGKIFKDGGGMGMPPMVFGGGMGEPPPKEKGGKGGKDTSIFSRRGVSGGTMVGQMFGVHTLGRMLVGPIKAAMYGELSRIEVAKTMGRGKDSDKWLKEYDVFSKDFGYETHSNLMRLFADAGKGGIPEKDRKGFVEAIVKGSKAMDFSAQEASQHFNRILVRGGYVQGGKTTQNVTDMTNMFAAIENRTGNTRSAPMIKTLSRSIEALMQMGAGTEKDKTGRFIRSLGMAEQISLAAFSSQMNMSPAKAGSELTMFYNSLIKTNEEWGFADIIAKEGMEGFYKVAERMKKEPLNVRLKVFGERAERFIRKFTSEGAIDELKKIYKAAKTSADEVEREWLIWTASFGAQFTKLKNEMVSLFIDIGTHVTDELTPILPNISGIIDYIREWIKLNPKLAKGISIVTASVTGLLVALGALSLLILTITGGAAALAGAWQVLLGVAATIGVIAAGIVYWDDLKEKIDNATISYKMFMIEVEKKKKLMKEGIDTESGIFGWFSNFIAKAIISIDFLWLKIKKFFKFLATPFTLAGKVLGISSGLEELGIYERMLVYEPKWKKIPAYKKKIKELEAEKQTPDVIAELKWYKMKVSREKELETILKGLYLEKEAVALKKKEDAEIRRKLGYAILGKTRGETRWHPSAPIITPFGILPNYKGNANLKQDVKVFVKQEADGSIRIDPNGKKEEGYTEMPIDKPIQHGEPQFLPETARRLYLEGI